MDYLIRINTDIGGYHYYQRPDEKLQLYRTLYKRNATVFHSLAEVRNEISSKEYFKNITSLDVVKLEMKEVETPISLLEVLTGE